MSESKSGCGGIVGFLAVIALIVVGLFAARWVYVEQDEESNKTNIVIDKEKAKTDTSNALDKVKQGVDNAAKGIEDATQEPEDEAEEAAEEAAENSESSSEGT